MLRRGRFLVPLNFPICGSFIKFASTSSSRPSNQALSTSSITRVDNDLLQSLKKQAELTYNEKLITQEGPTNFYTTRASIKSSLQTDDTVTLVQAVQWLNTHNLFYRLVPKMVFDVHNALFKVYKSLSKKWSHSERTAVETLFVHAAVQKNVDGLYICMLSHLQTHPEHVITLYNDFSHKITLQSKPKPESKGDVTEVENLQAPPETKAVYSHSKFLQLLLVTVSALALRGDYEGALKLVIESNIQIQTEQCELFYRELSFNPSLKDTVRRYVHKFDTTLLVYHKTALPRLIMRYSEAQLRKKLGSLYNTVLHAVSGPNAFLSPIPSAVSPSKPIAVPEVAWTAFLSAFLHNGMKATAAKLWKDMPVIGVPHAPSMWNCIIDFYVKQQAYNEAFAAWQSMQAAGIKPDGLTYRAVISMLFGASRRIEAMKLFRTVQKEQPRSEHILAIHNTVIDALLRRHRLQEALEVLDEMEAQGPHPDAYSYNAILIHCRRRKDMKMIASIITRMESRKVKLDAYSYSAILAALLNSGRRDTVDMILNLMAKDGLKATTEIWTSMIKDQFKNNQVELAMSLLKRMEDDDVLGAQPTVVTYTTVIDGLLHSASDAEDVNLVIDDVLERMKKRGLKLEARGYSILIRTSLGNPQPEGLEKALSFYRQMLKEQTRTTESLWYILLSGLARREEWQIALDIISDMHGSGYEATPRLMDLVSQIRGQAVDGTVPD